MARTKLISKKERQTVFMAWPLGFQKRLPLVLCKCKALMVTFSFLHACAQRLSPNSGSRLRRNKNQPDTLDSEHFSSMWSHAHATWHSFFLRNRIMAVFARVFSALSWAQLFSLSILDRATATFLGFPEVIICIIDVHNCAQ